MGVLADLYLSRDDEEAVRAEAERRFSDTAVVGEYEHLYERLSERLPRAAGSAA